MTQITTKSEKETIEHGINLTKELKGGEIIRLIGNLGAGKTILTKGIAKGLGIKQVVNSPTFVVIKVYNIKKSKIKHLVHIDAYRLKSAKDLTTIGAEEYLGRKNTVVVIEWTDKIKKS